MAIHQCRQWQSRARGFATRLAETVLTNLQINIRDVRIRLEVGDDVGPPFDQRGEHGGGGGGAELVRKVCAGLFLCVRVCVCM